MKSPLAIRFTLAAAAVLSAGTCALRVAAEENLRPVLSFVRTVYREASDETVRRWLRDRVHDGTDDARYGLQLDKDWQQAAAKSPQLPLMVFIHGFNSTAARNAGVIASIRAAGVPSASFAYPNDWSLANSAALLSRQLKAFATEYPDRKIALVTHSMGGLVARACIEDPALNPGNVTRLVMIAPPSQGTLVAHTAIGADVWEHWVNRHDGNFGKRWRDSIVDGLGEAADDLVPGSPFLTGLNARPRNPRVRYAIFLGTHSPVSAGEMELLRWTLHSAGSRVEHFRDYADSVDKLIADLDEVVDGKGDGVVAVKRGRLEGVEDIVLLPFDHLSCTGELEGDEVKGLQRELLARLQ